MSPKSKVQNQKSGTAKRYRVNAGLEFERKGKPVRYEPGDVADDLPAESLPWLLEQGIVSDHAGDSRATDSAQRATAGSSATE
jgi:hypothetical protein